MEREHLLSAVLADDTRFGIYRSIAEHPGVEVTVAQVASRFGLHPNVARMHLGKLEQAGFLTSGSRRGSGGGRPARLYRIADGVHTFAFPPRRYDLLAGLALDVVAATADAETVTRLCVEAGRRDGERHVLERGGRPAGVARLAAAIDAVARAQGLLPSVQVDGDELRIDLCNCVFREPADRHPELACRMHQAYLAGIIEALGGAAAGAVRSDGPSIGDGADCCRLVCPIDDGGAGRTAQNAW